MSGRSLLVACAMVVALAACSVANVETPDPAAIPSGSLEARGPEPTGPVIELGSGTDLSVGWRFSVYPSADGDCIQVELSVLTSTGCGELVPQGEDVFANVELSDPVADGTRVIHGTTLEATATVWMIGEDQRRAPAHLLSLEDADIEAGAFIGFIPADVNVVQLMSVAMSGEILDIYDLP